MFERLKFLLFRNLYLILNGLALKCYQLYWDALNALGDKEKNV